MADRDELRKKRYKELRQLGFSRKEATRLRDQSFDNIETSIELRQEQIENVPQRQRTPEQRQSLQRIRSYRSTPSRQGEFATVQNRQSNFNLWSANKAFPLWAQEQIDSFNREAGEPPESGYGYRVFYHMYVKRRARSTADRKIDENPNAIYDRRRV